MDFQGNSKRYFSINFVETQNLKIICVNFIFKNFDVSRTKYNTDTNITILFSV